MKEGITMFMRRINDRACDETGREEARSRRATRRTADRTHGSHCFKQCILIRAPTAAFMVVRVLEREHELVR